ncbi:MAG: hypothetical protein RSG57_06340, partial [Christensenellaceae bacterium]
KVVSLRIVSWCEWADKFAAYSAIFSLSFYLYVKNSGRIIQKKQKERKPAALLLCRENDFCKVSKFLA